ncbi:MAG: hypothetical protein WC263_04000 [Candidatus Micrarchaeia archaeon]|jgi:hypothetical protein
MIAQTKTNVNIGAAKALARKMREPAAKDRIGFAREGLAILSQVEPANGEAKMVARAANRLANALGADYATPKGMEAASVATALRALARGAMPFGSALYAPKVDSICLS